MKGIITAITLLLILGALGFIWTSYAGERGTDNSSSVSDSSEKLFVSSQAARDSVTVDRAVLTKGGYVVVRGSDGKRLGQVIEISKYLEAGEHKNITIELGDFYEYNPDDQLIAMIYHDDGDKTFNDLDQPLNTSPAVFVETGEAVPASVFEEQIAVHGGTGMETVRYTNDGFQPKKLTVPVGTMVEFVNQSDKTMWIASNVHPEHEILPTFDQFKEVPKGQSYMYTFDKKGTWPYHDHINPALEGTIVVE